MGLSGEMDGCGQFMKYSMFISNFIIFAGGITVFGLGIWTVMDKSFVNELLGTNLFIGAVYIIIATGALVSLIAFFGCLGAIKEIKCMLLTYSLILFIILVVMLVGGILGYVFREKVRRSMEQEMNLSIKLYKEKRSIRRAWDDTQENLQCCGVNSYTDWRGEIPDSCCKEINGQKRNCKTFPLSLNIHTQGCLNVTERYVKDHASIIAAAAVTVSSLMKQNCKSFQNSSNIYSKGCLNVTEKYVKDHASIIGAAAVTVSSLMVLGLIFSLAMFKMIE